MHTDFSVTGIDRLINDGESKWVEFKSNVPPDQVIAKHIVAFANTEGGEIIFGVGDKGTLLGIPENRVRNDLARLRRVVKTLLAYPVELKSMEHRGKHLIYLSVAPAPESLRPVMTAHGEIYTRHADRIHENKIAQQITSSLAQVEFREGARGTTKTVFVAMSFREEEEPALVDYYRAIERACKRVGSNLHLIKMDLVEGDYEISQRIMDEIDKADIVIADFTLNSRNVYFELGYCRGRKSAVIIQTARKDTALEFDVRSWRTLIYKNATELEEKLVGALEEAAKTSNKIR